MRSRRTSRVELVRRRALGRGAHDEPGVVRADAVEHLAQPLALVVGEALRDAVGLGLARHHHDEAAGEAHLLGEARALGADRVLRDLHEDHLPVLEQALDLRLVAALDLGLVEGDVAAVEHAVLRRADVDERGLHAREHVLHLAEVDVAVDRLVAGGRGQRVLDEAAALEHRDLGVTALAHVHAHQVAAGRTTLAGPAPAPLEDVVVELGGRCLADPEVGAHDVVAARLLLLRPTAAAGRSGAVPARLAAPLPPPAPPRPRPRPPRRRRRFGAVARLAVGRAVAPRPRAARARVADPGLGCGARVADPGPGGVGQARVLERDVGDVVGGQAAVGGGVVVVVAAVDLVVVVVVVAVVGARRPRRRAGAGARLAAVAAAARPAPAPALRQAVGPERRTTVAPSSPRTDSADDSVRDRDRQSRRSRTIRSDGAGRW